MVKYIWDQNRVRWELHGWVGQLLSRGFRGRTLWHRSNLFWGWDVLWLGIGWLTMGCGGYRSVWLVRRAEVGGCMDN